MTKLEPVLKESFVLWEPRDRVGGDVYWCDYWGDGVLIVLADCTGHGVPGAFLTMLSTGALDHARMKVIGGDLQGLVSEFHKLLQQSLGQDIPGSNSDDGLELGACYITPDIENLYFVGACFDLFVVENGEINILRGTRKGIGYSGIPADQFFDVHHIELAGHQSFSVSTDGLIDQIGGARNRSFGKKRLKELLRSVQHLSMTEQGDAIRRTLVEYQGGQPRRDDVAAIGFRVL